MEQNGGELEDMLAVVSGKPGLECYKNGDTEGSCFSIGVGATLIEEIKSAKQIIDEMVTVVHGAAGRLQATCAL